MTISGTPSRARDRVGRGAAGGEQSDGEHRLSRRRAGARRAPHWRPTAVRGCRVARAGSVVRRQGRADVDLPVRLKDLSELFGGSARCVWRGQGGSRRRSGGDLVSAAKPTSEETVAKAVAQDNSSRGVRNSPDGHLPVCGGAPGSCTVTQSPPAVRGVSVRVPLCAWVMLLTIARPRPTPAWSVRMRLVPR
jgi:hypothetical protein